MRLLAVLSMLLISLLNIGCSSTATSPEDPATRTYTQLATTTVDGVTATLYTHGPLKAGYNSVYISFNGTSTPVEASFISVNTMMDMGMMQHSSPVIQPTASNTFGDFEAGVIFQMAGTSEQWSLIVELDRPINIRGTDVLFRCRGFTFEQRTSVE